MNFNIMANFFWEHGFIFSLYLVLSCYFLDILRQLDRRPVNIRIYFACLTAGCFSISIYALAYFLPSILILLGLGLMPLCAHKVRYSFI